MGGAPFRDATVLVTGGSSGIGFATARLLTAQGADVFILARDRAKLAAAVAALRECARAKRQKIISVAADVANYEEVKAAVCSSPLSASAPDLIINSAGAAHPGYVENIDVNTFRSLMEVNYLGTVHVVKIFLPELLERGSGHIVNISSVAGFVGVFGYTAYGASKYAVRGFSDALRSELKPRGIKVSIVFPPDTDTPQFAHERSLKPPETKLLGESAGRLSPEKVARSILTGVSAGRYVILPGFRTKLLYYLASLLGGVTYSIMDRLVARARERMRDTPSSA